LTAIFRIRYYYLSNITDDNNTWMMRDTIIVPNHGSILNVRASITCSKKQEEEEEEEQDQRLVKGDVVLCKRIQLNRNFSQSSSLLYSSDNYIHGSCCRQVDAADRCVLIHERMGKSFHEHGDVMTMTMMMIMMMVRRRRR